MLDLLTAFALVAVVLMISALASGLIERAPLSFPMIFLGLGFLLGPRGFGLVVIMSVAAHGASATPLIRTLAPGWSRVAAP